MIAEAILLYAIYTTAATSDQTWLGFHDEAEACKVLALIFASIDAY